MHTSVFSEVFDNLFDISFNILRFFTAAAIDVLYITRQLIVKFVLYNCTSTDYFSAKFY